MITQELIDFIKQSSQQNISDDDIKKSLLAAGWQENDINEAFASLAAIQPKNASDKETKKTNNTKKIAIFGAIIIAITAAAAYYWLNFYQSPAPPNETIQVNSSASKTAEAQTIDCGVSQALATSTALNMIDFKNASALACIGNNILNGCKEAKAVLNTNDGVTIYSVNQKNNSECWIKFQAGSADQIRLEKEKKYANQFFECSVKNVKDAVGIKATDSEIAKDPAGLAASLMIGLNFYNFENDLSKIGCTASVPDLLKSAKDRLAQDPDANMTATDAYLKMKAEFDNTSNFDEYFTVLKKYATEENITKFEKQVETASASQKEQTFTLIQSLSPKKENLKDIKETIHGNTFALDITTDKPNLIGKVVLTWDTNDTAWKLVSETWTQK